MRPYQIYRRSNGYYYAALRNPESGDMLPARSTNRRTRDEAVLVAAEWAKSGTYPEIKGKRIIFSVEAAIRSIQNDEWTEDQIERAVRAMASRNFIQSAKLKDDSGGDIPLYQYLSDLWDYDSSIYVKERLAFGFSIHRRHCISNSYKITHWKAFFGEKLLLSELTKNQLEDFQLYLKTEKNLAPKTINLIISAGKIGIEYAFKKGMILSNPIEGLQRFGGKSQKRGILTSDELHKLFSEGDWPNEIFRVMALTAAYTGLRLGEVRGLRPINILDDRINLTNAWSNHDGLKPLKNNDESRQVPLPDFVRKEILDLIAKNPRGGEEDFIFFSVKDPTVPASENRANEHFKAACKSIGVDFRERHVSYHSLRHGYSTVLCSMVGSETLQTVLGHHNKAMTVHYSNHRLEENFREVKTAAFKAFNGGVA